MKISVIIPAFNEEKYLPKLLTDLKKQTFKDFEVIVADAFSTDQTRQVARKYGAKVVDGGRPAVGRNAGAKIALGDFLYFFDADIRLKKDFLQKSYAEIQERYLDLATCELIPISDLIIDKVFHHAANIYIKLRQFSQPRMPGCCILVTQRLFERVGGFNEKLKLEEDNDFANRASNFRSLNVLLDVQVLISVRRMKKEGRMGLMEKYLKAVFYQSFFREISDDLFDYEFGNFSKGNNNRIEKLLIKYDKKLSALNNEISKKMRQQLKKNVVFGAFVEQNYTFEKQFQKMLESIKKLFNLE